MTSPQSEYRLHPVALLLFLAAQVKDYLFGMVALIIGSGGDPFGNVIAAGVTFVLLGGFVVAPAVVRMLTFRYRYEPDELVIRWGWLARKERHIPYVRIQSLDARENILHRMTSTVEVSIETGGGAETEGKIPAIPRADLAIMRERVLAERSLATPADPANADATDDRQLLAQLGTKELLLTGLILNKGMVLVATVVALVYEWGLGDRLLLRFLGPEAAERGTFMTLFGMLRGAVDFTPRGLLTGAVMVIVFLVSVRLLSMLLTIVRYHDHRLERIGTDLRVTCGLFTRSTSTTPIRRIQSVTVREGPWHRMAGRVTVQVATAGGSALETSMPSREVLAPLLRRDQLADLLTIGLEGTLLPETGWRTAAQPSTRRVITGILIVWTVLGIGAWLLGPPAFALAMVLAGLSLMAAVARVRNFRWIALEGGVALQTGWIWRLTTIARHDRIQLAMLEESPFDRRHDMAQVTVDTAGSAAPTISLPWLTRDDASNLVARLDARIAATEYSL